MNQQRIINAALDTISRFKTSKMPLKNVARDIIAARKLNSSERKALLDLVFSWARQSFIINYYLKNHMRFYEGISEQQKDLIAIKLLASWQESEDIKNLKDGYDAYLKSLSDERYLLALGEVITSELKKSFGDQAIFVAKGLFSTPKKYLAFDSTKLSLSSLLGELNRQGIKATPHVLAPFALAVSGDFDLLKLPPNLQESVWFMDAGSQFIAELIKPQASERVLDMCAGEGNKARYVTMNPCNYVAIDMDGERLKKARKRLKDKNIVFIEQDALLVNFDKGFDWILLDAPCSGSGTLRRHPDLIYRLKKSDLEHYQKLQQKLLTKAVTLLNPHGKLVYATCSLFARENKQQIERLLSSDKKLKALPLNHLLVNQDANINEQDLNKSFIELIPHIHDCDGFFVSVIIKSLE